MNYCICYYHKLLASPVLITYWLLSMLGSISFISWPSVYSQTLVALGLINKILLWKALPALIIIIFSVHCHTSVSYTSPAISSYHCPKNMFHCILSFYLYMPTCSFDLHSTSHTYMLCVLHALLLHKIPISLNLYLNYFLNYF